MKKIKIFLVEDEIVIRNGIKESINWEKEGYEFVGEASDGELAYPLILKEKPDILITDIKMPFMDGLELSKHVKKIIPDIKILILSGYDEFEYAKEAIRIGVTEYLLKPISSTKLLEILRQVSLTIEQEYQEKHLREKYLEEMKENTEHEKLKFFERLIIGNMSMKDVLNISGKFHMNLGASCYRIMLFKIHFTMVDYDSILECFNEACKEIDFIVSNDSSVESFKRGVEGWAFLIKAGDSNSIEENTVQLINHIETTMSKYDNLEYFGSVGGCVQRIRNLCESFKEAEKIFATRFTSESNQIIDCNSKVSKKISCEEHIYYNGVVQIGRSREMIEKFLNNGIQAEVETFTDAYLTQMGEENVRSTMIRQYVVMDICIVIMSFCEKLSDSKQLQKEVEELQNIMRKIHSMSEIRNYIIRLLNMALNIRDTISRKRYSDIIIQAQNKINDLYMSEDISLNMIATDVGMSPSYFSSIFSKETGKTFIEYLTNKRMEKAKELLMCSSMKTSEIGFEVGYKDPHYFSYIFKKTQGCSPKEYRARRKE